MQFVDQNLTPIQLKVLVSFLNRLIIGNRLKELIIPKISRQSNLAFCLLNILDEYPKQK